MRKSPRCCGGKWIDNPFANTCCRDRIILTSQAPFCKRMSECGHNSMYNGNYQRCCKGQVIPRIAKCKQLRCNRDRYYPFNEQCCNGRLIPKHVPCNLFPTQCGGVSYDPSFQKCCSTRVVPIHFSCPAVVPCGHTFINPSFQRCCYGNVVAPLRSTCQRCGASLYVPFGCRCCYGTRLVPTFVRCPHVYG